MASRTWRGDIRNGPERLSSRSRLDAMLRCAPLPRRREEMRTREAQSLVFVFVGWQAAGGARRARRVWCARGGSLSGSRTDDLPSATNPNWVRGEKSKTRCITCPELPTNWISPEIEQWAKKLRVDQFSSSIKVGCVDGMRDTASARLPARGQQQQQMANRWSICMASIGCEQRLGFDGADRRTSRMLAEGTAPRGRRVLRRSCSRVPDAPYHACSACCSDE